MFQVHGKVTKVRPLVDTNMRPWAMVEYELEESARVAKGKMDGVKFGKRTKLSVKFCPRNLFQAATPAASYLSTKNFFGRMLFTFLRSPSNLSQFHNYLSQVKDPKSAALITAQMSYLPTPVLQKCSSEYDFFVERVNALASELNLN